MLLFSKFPKLSMAQFSLKNMCCGHLGMRKWTSIQNFKAVVGESGPTKRNSGLFFLSENNFEIGF